MTRYVHFTLGPVQSFVSQARRTRDFWAGSFLLSWLAGVAMKAVEAQQGRIRFPTPDIQFMEALITGGQGPHQGGIPNRFVAEVPPGFDAKVIVETVQAAWRALAEAVHESDLKQFESLRTRAVWNRQINGFWEISWALTDDELATDLLDRRKNWRSHLPPDEPGLKCMMMDGWQELSGEAGPGVTETDKFWRRVREGAGKGIKTDLRPDEHLCAIAFVKRRFVRHFAGLAITLPGGLAIKGWQLPQGVPSVAYMAAAPWLAALLNKADDDALRQFHDAAHELTGSYGEWDTNIACVRNADAPKRWKSLDGNVFFENVLDNKNVFEDQAQAQRVKKQLRKLREVARLDPVSPFYALLLMDGDSLGANMSDPSKQKAITDGLAKFTRGVHDIVQQHNGFPIYAGGDDVLALVTLDQALPCAAALRRHYLDCFRGSGVETSLSGAIEYAHIKTPLGRVLHDAHELLGNVAKDGCGRDAIAVRVWKSGGLALQWAMPWEIAAPGGEPVIARLVKAFAAADEDRQFSSKFFYRIRERFEMLNPAEKNEPRVLSDEQAEILLASEYLNSGVATARNLDKARGIVRPLLEQCRPVTRLAGQPQDQWERDKTIRADAALLVRFLAQKGIER